jgi:diguanylate cyclase (GGDEF)-like protein
VRIREFNASRRPLLQEIAQHISLAVKAKHLHMKSVTDGLTLLYSKSHFSRQLDAHVDFAVRNAQPFSLILLDIDHFKQVNDNYGHASGDVVLSGIAETIRNSLRKYDSAYRIGGEELAVLLPRTDLGRAAAIAERLRTRIEKQKFVAKENVPIRVTVSCGVAQYHAGDTSETLFSRTDQCLYSAKENGRNCIATEAA